ncbi:MAG: DUF4270 family protein [Bacteroidetes bacterium]|nr:DUF4270 family protein [Bacteroidota bacterium]
MTTYTVSEDSIRTDELSTFALGSINNDPIFGASSSNFYSHFLLPTDNWSFGNNAKLDSVVLTMAYTGEYYGDITSSQYFTVRELNEEITYNTNYFSNSTFQNSHLIGLWQGVHKPTDSVAINSTNVDPHLRIRLADDFGKSIIANGKTWLDNPDFLNTFKGIAIKAENTSNTGCQVYFNPASKYSAVTVYYNDTSSLSFSLYSNGARASARISQYKHQLNNGIKKDINIKRNADTAYIQAQASTKLKIEIPHLKNLVDENKNANIVIHGAELTIKPLSGTNSNEFPYPTKLLLVKSDSLGNNTPILDLYLTAFSNTYIGGTYNSDKSKYTFNFLNEMQEVFKNYYKGTNNNYGYYVLIPGDNPMTASRLVVDTRKNPKQIQFKLTYSVVK